MKPELRPSNGHARNKANLRRTNPNLYRSLMTIALTKVALGLNFLLTTPTFEQYNIPKNLIGVGFLVLGLSYLIVLNLWRNLKAVRILLVVGIAYMLFWGVGTTQTFFQGVSSLQLFILYTGLAALHAPLLTAPFLNIVMDRGEK